MRVSRKVSSRAERDMCRFMRVIVDRAHCRLPFSLSSIRKISRTVIYDLMYVRMSTAGGLSSASFSPRMRKPQAEAVAILRFSLSPSLARSPLFFKTMLFFFFFFFFSRTFRYCILQIHISSAASRERASLKFHSRSFLSIVQCEKKTRERGREEEEFRFFSTHTHTHIYT